ncbi:MAG: Gfo/Idh/MocA family oxidoreductase [Acidobacteriota bacterium]|nr:MAG: Gfo/Idh/MocA family oxidoreductase [Acidobacteriota bacterium]
MTVSSNGPSRREFLRTSAAASGGARSLIKAGAQVAGSDRLRVGLIGCGGRGSGAARNVLDAAPGIELYSLGDLFPEPLEDTLEMLQRERPDSPMARFGNQVNISRDRCFVGFDAYQKVIDSGIDVVLMATPPNFRPIHLAAAVDAGIHSFIEKPVAVDPVGVRQVIETSELAKTKGLAIVAGTQRRHSQRYLEMVKRIHRGDIGEIVGGQIYFLIHNTPWLGKHRRERQPGWSDMEWQCRCWYWFNWLSGDHIVEQFVHSIDFMNWAMGGPPVSCLGVGGREVRKGPDYGNIFDHFAIEYEFPGDVRIAAMCRQIDTCTNRISNRIVGAMGIADLEEDAAVIKGARAYVYEGPEEEPQVQEHTDMIASIRAGIPLNEGRQIAESSLTAIMGRMSAYTGKEVEWDWVLNESKLDLSPPRYEFGDLPVRPVAIPGTSPLI